jgi:hypothetical protein
MNGTNGYFERDLASLACVNILQKSKANQIGEHAGATVRKEWKRHSSHGHET